MKRKSHRRLELVGSRIDLRVLSETPPWEWPRDTGKRLLAVLADRQAGASDRLVAARCAGDPVVVNDALCDALVSILRAADEPEELRAAAAIALGPVLEQADTFGFEDDPDDVPITGQTFQRVQGALQRVYLDDGVPKFVRRRILEASVRAPEEWHRDAIGQGYSSGDREWVLTAVFAMQYVRGFNDQILEALGSGDSDIHFHAVCAAGNREVDAAWDYIAPLAIDSATPKPLRLAAIEAIGSIRPREARDILYELTDSHDEEIAEAAQEALALAPPEDNEDWEDDDDAGGWVH